MKKNVVSQLFALARSISLWNARGRVFELDEVATPRSPRGGVNMPVTVSVGGAQGAQVGGGFTNIKRTHIFGGTIPQHYDAMVHRDFEDFDRYSATDWAITDTGIGTSALVANFNGGALQLKNDNAGNGDLRQMQRPQCAFLPVAGKPLLFSARFSVDDATLGLFIVGLQSANANAFAPPADGVWFSHTAGAGLTDFNVSSTAAGLSTTASVATVVAGTQVELNFVYDGEKKIHYGVNGAEVGSVSDANLPLVNALAPIAAIKNGSGVARNMQLDWLYALNVR